MGRQRALGANLPGGECGGKDQVSWRGSFFAPFFVNFSRNPPRGQGISAFAVEYLYKIGGRVRQARQKEDENMLLRINGKGMSVSAYTERIARKKAQKLERYFREDAEVTLLLSREKDRHIAEVTVPFYEGRLLRAEEVGDRTPTPATTAHSVSWSGRSVDIVHALQRICTTRWRWTRTPSMRTNRFWTRASPSSSRASTSP